MDTDTNCSSGLYKKKVDLKFPSKTHCKKVKSKGQDIDESKPISSPSFSMEEENLTDYRLGGYHPVKVGDLFCEGRYRVIRKLGWGQYSTVWLVFDTKDNRHVALKIIKSAKSYTEAALDELKLLKKVSSSLGTLGRKHVVELLDSFEHKGPNGIHICMVFEVLGENLFSLLQFYPKGLPIILVKQIAKQLLLGLKYLHNECGIIHTDIKPENILVSIEDYEKIIPESNVINLKNELIQESRPLNFLNTFENISTDSCDTLTQKLNNITLDSQIQPGVNKKDLKLNISVKIVDLGNSCWVKKHFTDDIQTRHYRSPEVIVQGNWNSSVDVWSLACLLFELLTGDYLFEPLDGKTFDKDDDHLAQIIELLGPVPSSIHSKGKFSSKLFIRKSQLRQIKDLNAWSLPDILRDKYFLSDFDAESFSSFLIPMLDYDISRRGKLDNFLNHPWLS